MGQHTGNVASSTFVEFTKQPSNVNPTLKVILIIVGDAFPCTLAIQEVAHIPRAEERQNKLAENLPIGQDGERFARMAALWAEFEANEVMRDKPFFEHDKCVS